MNRALAREIVESLSESDTPAASTFGSFSTQDWQTTMSWLHGSGLTFHFLKKLDQQKLVPAEIRNRMQTDFAANRLRMADMFQEFRCINERFLAAGLSFAVQKGFSLIPEYCDETGLRHQTDFDYLVAPQSLDQARSILRSRGYSGESHYDQEFVLRTPLTRPLVENDFFGLQPTRSVELHLSLWEEQMCQVSLRAPQDALQRVQMHSFKGHSFPALAPEDIFLTQGIHVLRHIFSFWGRLSWLFEVANFMKTRQDTRDFWERVRVRANGDTRVGEALGVVLSLVQEVFGASIPPALAAWTTETLSPRPQLWVKRYGWEFSLAPAPGSKLSLLLQEHFMASAEDWRRQRRDRLFPLHRPMAFASEPPAGRRRSMEKFRQRSVHTLRRTGFHLRSFLRYIFELPRWRWALRRARLRQSTYGVAS